MSFTYTETVTFNDGISNIITNKPLTAPGAEVWSGTIPINTTNQQIHMAFAVANVVSMTLSNSSTVPLVLKTNSTSTPQDTITLAANTQLSWNTSHHEAIPFAGDITAIYVSNASGTVVPQFDIRVLLNS